MRASEEDYFSSLDDDFESVLAPSIKELPNDEQWQDWLKREQVVFDRMSKIKKIIGFCSIDGAYLDYMANNR